MQHEIPIQQFAEQIAVDDRERASRVPEALRRKTGATVTVRRLQLGDYVVDNSLIVERKTLSDFTLSVRDGRLFDQVSRLTRQRDLRTCLILEGTPRQYPRLAISRPAFQGALVTVTLVFGLPVLRSAGPDETADLILYAAHQLQRRETRPPRRRYRGVGALRRTQLLLLQSIPEVGPLKAQLLLDAYSSPADVAGATLEQIAAIDGIGLKTAEKVHRVFHGSLEDR